MIDISVLLKDIVSVSNPLGALVRDMAIRLAVRTPWLGRWIREARFKPKPIYRRGSYFGLQRGWRGAGAGTMFPQPDVRTFEGKRVLLGHLLGENFALIGLGLNPRIGLSQSSFSLLESLGCRFLTLYPFGHRPQGSAASQNAPDDIVEVEDPGDLLVDWFRRSGFKNNAVAIVRPDRFAFAVVDVNDCNEAVESLREQLRPPQSGNSGQRFDRPSPIASEGQAA